MKPNIVFIIMEQQRYDTIRAHGYEHMITPNMDKLCRGGVSFTSAFAPGATCVASRAALFTGMYAHNTGVYSFNRWAHQNTWVTDLADEGYHCVNVGKMHCDPIFSKNGFHERWIVENKAQDFVSNGLGEDDWGKFLLGNGLKRPLNRADMYDDWKDRLNTVAWEYDEKFHADVFVGDSASRWIKNWDQRKPLFMEIGFTGPHEPYDAPQKYVDLYSDVEVPPPVYVEGELDQKPAQQKKLQRWFRNTPNNAVINYKNASDEKVKETRKHYYANITLIDEKIGQIINAIDEKGMLDNTVLFFISDHGDSLGDHKLAYKWLMYDAMVRVPFIIKDFRKRASGKMTKIEDVISLMNIGPTILDYAGCNVPTYIEGNSLVKTVETGQMQNADEYVFCEDNYLVMARSQNHKMVYYIAQDYGELYDMDSDPHELNNLWDRAEHQQLKLKFKSAILDWMAKSTYFNGGYKQGKGRQYKIRWPNRDGFDLYLQGSPAREAKAAAKR